MYIYTQQTYKERYTARTEEHITKQVKGTKRRSCILKVKPQFLPAEEELAKSH